MEMQTSKSDSNCMSPQVYADVVRQISEIRALFTKRSNNNQDADPCNQLVEIETYINKILKFMQLAKMADPVPVSKLMRQLQNKFKELKRVEGAE